MEIVVRLLKKEEIPAAVAIAKANNQQEKACIDDLEDMFSNSNSLPIYLVALSGKKIIGFLGYRSSFMTFGIQDIFWVMVDPMHQRKGVGKKLMEHVLTHIKNAGNRFSRLMTHIPKYYEQFGFTIIEETEPGEYLMTRKC